MKDSQIFFREEAIEPSQRTSRQREALERIHDIRSEYGDGVYHEAEFQEIPLSPEMKMFIPACYDAFRTYYRGLGIEIPDGLFPRPEQIHQIAPGSQGDGNGGCINLFAKGLEPSSGEQPRKRLIFSSYSSTEDPRFVILDLMRNFSHELWHFLAPVKMGLVTASGGRSAMFLERLGVAYGKRLDKTQKPGDMKGKEAIEKSVGVALEEGCNVVIEGRITRSVIEQILPGHIDLLKKVDNILSEHKAAQDNPIESLFPFSLTEQTFEDGEIRSSLKCNRVYPESVKLVKFIQSRIPNLLELVENARMKGKTVALARAIEKHFGKGAYRKIVMAREEGAAMVLHELQSPKE